MEIQKYVLGLTIKNKMKFGDFYQIFCTNNIHIWVEYYTTD